MRPNVRQTATLYIRWQNPVDQMTKSFRRVLTNVFLDEAINSIARQTGIVQNQSYFAQIFNQPDLQYVPLHVWKNIGNPEKDPYFNDYDLDTPIEERLAKYWSIDPLNPASIFVDHETDVEFKWTTWTLTTNEENKAFITPATAEPGARRIASVEDNRRGTERAQYVLIRG